MGEMIKTSNKICISCKYCMRMSGYNSGISLACDYLNRTGNMRNCEVGLCDKYEKRESKRRTKTSDEN